jgi:hypothetical protein
MPSQRSSRSAAPGESRQNMTASYSPSSARMSCVQVPSLPSLPSRWSPNRRNACFKQVRRIGCPADGRSGVTSRRELLRRKPCRIRPLGARPQVRSASTTTSSPAPSEHLHVRSGADRGREPAHYRQPRFLSYISGVGKNRPVLCGMPRHGGRVRESVSCDLRVPVPNLQRGYRQVMRSSCRDRGESPGVPGRIRMTSSPDASTESFEGD